MFTRGELIDKFPHGVYLGPFGTNNKKTYKPALLLQGFFCPFFTK
jgi:hypothetical protein